MSNKRHKRVELSTPLENGRGRSIIGHAYLSKNDKGEVEVEATITAIPLIDQLGGTKIKGIIPNYEKDDLD